LTTAQRPLDCPEVCRNKAESSAHEAVGDAGARLLLAWLEKLKPIVQLTPRSFSEARVDAAAWNLLRDFAAKEVALRDGNSEQSVWQTTYTKSSRARQQRALHYLRRPKEAHSRSRFHRFLVSAIATQVKDIRGRWPSYSSASGYGGKDVLRVQDWLNWLFCPRHSNLDKVSHEVIVKCLKALCRDDQRSSHDRLRALLHIWTGYRLLLMAQADFVALQRATGGGSDELRVIRAARRSLATLVCKFPPSQRRMRDRR
jgi:hypothetical protein